MSICKLPDHQVKRACGGAPRGSYKIKVPDIEFSEWFAWDDIKSIPKGEGTGLYIIARFDKKPIGPALPSAKEVLYIGETHGKSQSIHKRLCTFFKAARVGEMLHKHSGGNRFNRELKGDLTNVYVAGFSPILEDEGLLNPFIFYTERKLLWEYILKWGCIPSCNGY